MVHDVRKNFEERWLSQAEASVRGNLVNICEREDLNADYSYTEDNSWNCQLFRQVWSTGLSCLHIIRLKLGIWIWVFNSLLIKRNI